MVLQIRPQLDWFEGSERVVLRRSVWSACSRFHGVVDEAAAASTFWDFVLQFCPRLGGAPSGAVGEFGDPVQEWCYWAKTVVEAWAGGLKVVDPVVFSDLVVVKGGIRDLSSSTGMIPGRRATASKDLLLAVIFSIDSESQ